MPAVKGATRPEPELIESTEIQRREESLPATIDGSGDIFSVIARAAADPSIDISKMERLIALRDRELARVAEEKFNAAMQSCQAELPAIFKDRENPHTKSWYATLESVNRRIVPVYTRNGFSLSFGTKESNLEGFIRLTCRVSHIGGHSQDYQADLPLDGAGAKGNSNKTGVQAFGSTVSYGRRYLTCLIFNITLTNEDNDGRPLGQAPDADPDAPKVLPRAQRNQPPPETDELKAAVMSVYGLWKTERADADKTWAAFFAWATKVTGGPDLSVKHNWTLEAVAKCEEACK